jgi:hypothetical protein
MFFSLFSNAQATHSVVLGHKWCNISYGKRVGIRPDINSGHANFEMLLCNNKPHPKLETRKPGTKSRFLTMLQSHNFYKVN